MRRISILMFLLFWSVALWAARDPTMPATAGSLASAAGADIGNVVTMILVSPKRKVAVVNGSFVGPGDIVGKEKIIDIRPEYVIIENTETGERQNASVSGRDLKLYAR